MFYRNRGGWVFYKKYGWMVYINRINRSGSCVEIGVGDVHK